MPTSPISAEIFDRLRAVETAITSHTSECSVRNKQRERWEAEIDGDVKELKLDRAKFMGIAIAVSTIASALGSGGALAVLKLLGK